MVEQMTSFATILYAELRDIKPRQGDIYEMTAEEYEMAMTMTEPPELWPELYAPQDSDDTIPDSQPTHINPINTEHR